MFSIPFLYLNSIEFGPTQINPHLNNYKARHNTESIEVDLTFFLPIICKHEHYLNDWILPSLFLFWPTQIWTKSNITFLLLFDNESQQVKCGTNIKQLWFNKFRDELNMNLQVKFADYPSDIYSLYGWVKQQYLMFIADYFVSTTYVAFIDSDIVFQTLILPNTLFEINNVFIKPLLIGDVGHRYFWVFYKAALTTVQWLNISREPMICMNSFPFTMYTNHLAKIRYNINNKYNTISDFHIAFAAKQKETDTMSLYQFNIFCGYLFNHEFDKYYWYIETSNPLIYSDQQTVDNINYSNSTLSDNYFKDDVVNYSKSSDNMFQGGNIMSLSSIREMYKKHGNKANTMSFNPIIRNSNHLKYIFYSNTKVQKFNEYYLNVNDATNVRINKLFSVIGNWKSTENLNHGLVAAILGYCLSIRSADEICYSKNESKCNYIFDVKYTKLNPYLYQQNGKAPYLYNPNSLRRNDMHYESVHQFINKHEFSFKEKLVQNFYKQLINNTQHILNTTHVNCTWKII